MNNPDLATLESLFDHLPDVAFFVKDTGGRYRVVNESLVERCGLRSRNEVLGKHARELFRIDGQVIGYRTSIFNNSHPCIKEAKFRSMPGALAQLWSRTARASSYALFIQAPTP